MPSLSAEEYQEIKRLYDAPNSGLTDEDRARADAAIQGYENTQLQGWAGAGPAPPEGVIGQGGAPSIDPPALQSKAQDVGVREQLDKAQAVSPAPTPEAPPDLMLSLDPSHDLLPQALAVQPATTHRGGDKAAAEEWVRSGGADAKGTVFVYEPPVNVIQKRLLEDAALSRALRPNLPIAPDEIANLSSGDSLYQRAADNMWREAAEAAAGAGKTAFRYSKAPWLHDGKAMSGLQSLGANLKGGIKPVSEGITAFVMGIDDTANLGIGRAAVETVNPDVKEPNELLGIESVGGVPSGAAKERNAAMASEYPNANLAGQALGALSGWGVANRLWEGITTGGAKLAAKAGTGAAGRVAQILGSGLSAGVAAGTTQAAQEGVNAAASMAQTGSPGTSLGEAGERIKGAGTGWAPALGAAGAAGGQVAEAGANALRGLSGGRIGRVERAGVEFSPVWGAKLSPETKALIKRGEREDLLPGDLLAEEVAPKVAKAATDELEAAYETVRQRQVAFGQTREGKARLPATTLTNRSVELLDKMHGPNGGKLAPLRADGIEKKVKRVFNNEIGKVSTKPQEGAIALSPEQAEAYLNRGWQEKLVPPPKAKPPTPTGGGNTNEQGVNVIQAKATAPEGATPVDGLGPNEGKVTIDDLRPSKAERAASPTRPSPGREEGHKGQREAMELEGLREAKGPAQREAKRMEKLSKEQSPPPDPDDYEAFLRGEGGPSAKLPPEVQAKIDDGALTTEAQQKAQASKDRATPGLDSFPKRERVQLADVRKKLGGMPREEQDALLKQLQRDGKLVLYRNDNPRSLTQADKDSAMDVGGNPRHIVYFTGAAAVAGASALDEEGGSGAAAAGAAGLASALKRRGISKVYVVPVRRSALEHEEVIRGLRVKGNDDPDVVRQLKHAARADRGPRGPEWQKIMQEDSELLGATKAVKRLVAPKNEGGSSTGSAFNTLAGHGSRNPGELKKVRALRHAAEKGGATKELSQIRNLDDLMQLRGQQASVPVTRAGFRARAANAGSVRAFPILKSLEGPLGPLRSGKFGRLGAVGDEEKEGQP